MTTLKKDFEFLQSIFIQFFKQKKIIDKLNQIENLELSGWEIWLQVELMIFFSSIDEVAEVYREERCSLDKRKSKFKTLCAIDFIIRQKNAHEFIPLEIKQDISATKCIYKMLQDIEKYNRIKESELFTGRALWCVGVHRKVTKEHIREQIREYDLKHIISYEIKGTNYMFTLF